MPRTSPTPHQQYEALRDAPRMLNWVLWAFRVKGWDTAEIAKQRHVHEAAVVLLLDEARRRERERAAA